jgi:hypothetical protein
MKNKLILIAVLLMTTLFTVEAKEDEMKGTWKLISQNGKDVTGRLNQIKFITETNFIWIRFDDNGEIHLGASGKFAVEGQTFTETIVMAFSGMKSFIGQEFIYDYEVEDNKLYMKGKSGVYSGEEVWERIE